MTKQKSVVADTKIYRDCNFIFLPTDNANNILLVLTDAMEHRERSKGNIELHDSPHEKSEYFQPHHIYITSNDKNDKIEDGDWFYSSHYNTIQKNDGHKGLNEFNGMFKKIIATTNPELNISASDRANMIREGWTYDILDKMIIPSISKSGIEYIIKLYNQNQKEVGVEMLAWGSSENRISSGDIDDVSDYKLGFKDGHNQAIQVQSGGLHELSNWLEILLSAESKLGASDDVIKILLSVQHKIESIINEQPKTDTIMVEYENVNSGWQQLANSGKPGSTFIPSAYKPKLDKDGNVIIKK